MASSISFEVRDALSRGLKNRYGVNLEVISGRPAEFVPKLQKERKAGIYTADCIISGISTVLATLAPDGDLEPLERFLVLPEVLDETLWFERRLRFVDKNHNLIGMVSVPKRPIAFNKGLVKPGEIQSYRDLLEPKWKGKIVIHDPTIGGSGNDAFQALADYIMDLNYLQELGKQDPIVIRDERLMAEWLARGKYPLLWGANEEVLNGFIAMGAPIMLMSPKEGTWAIISAYGLSVLKNAAHPAATKLFINWLLSREGQTLLSRSALVQSLRVDVPKDHIPLEMRLNPEEHYFWPDTDPEIAKKRANYRKVAQEMWGNLMR